MEVAYQSSRLENAIDIGVGSANLASAVDGNDNQTLAWTTPQQGASRLFSTTRTPGVSFDKPSAVSPAGQDVRLYALDVDESGRAALAWIADGAVWYSERPAHAGTWSVATRVA